MSGLVRLLALCALLIASPLAAAERATVFAAASLKEALDAAVAAWGNEATVSYGGSAAQARQVSQGAPADIVFLADPDWIRWLDDNGHLLPGSTVTLLGNRLVVVAPEGASLLDPTPAALAARLEGGGRIAMGHPRSVPAGTYARRWLEGAGLWDDVQGHLAETENVRAALALVARGEAPLGIVYATDAQAEPRVTVVYAVPTEATGPIAYPIALTSGASDAGRDLFSFLQGPQAARIFAAHGFETPGVPE